MQEKWKEVKGYDKKYYISNYGRIKSVWRYRTIHGKLVKVYKEIIMSPTDNGNGYLIVGFKMKNKRKNFYVHRLVAEYFIENKDNKKIINHLDYNKKNNNFTNLEWCTQLENVEHSINNMRKPKKRIGENFYITKNSYGYIVIVKKIYVGIYKTIEKARKARDEKIKELNYY